MTDNKLQLNEDETQTMLFNFLVDNEYMTIFYFAHAQGR